MCRQVTILLGVLLLSACAAQHDPQQDFVALAAALDDRPKYREGLIRSCSDVGMIDEVLAQAIAIGAPIFNAGSPLGCYRIYEGAAYKLLYLLGDDCPDASAVLRAGLARAEEESGHVQQAWMMRRIFDTLLGHPTRTGGGEG